MPRLPVASARPHLGGAGNRLRQQARLASCADRLQARRHREGEADPPHPTSVRGSGKHRCTGFAPNNHRMRLSHPTPFCVFGIENAHGPVGSVRHQVPVNSVCDVNVLVADPLCHVGNRDATA